MFAMLLAFLAASALAEEGEKLPINMNVGGFGIVLPGDGWAGQYVAFGPSVYVPLSKRVGIIPSVAFETAPGTGAWGFAGMVTFEYGLTEHIGLDFTPSVLQDTLEDETTFFVIAGPGITYFTQHHVAVSIVCPVGSDVGGHVFLAAPGLNLSVPFP